MRPHEYLTSSEVFQSLIIHVVRGRRCLHFTKIRHDVFEVMPHIAATQGSRSISNGEGHRGHVSMHGADCNTSNTATPVDRVDS